MHIILFLQSHISGHHESDQQNLLIISSIQEGEGSDAVGKAACYWKVRDRAVAPRSCIQVSKKHNVLPRLLVKIQYCGDPP